MRTPLHAGLDAAHDAIGPDTIAKFLLTSGSTGNPKAVINTQRMICANQVMIRETMAFLKDEPPVIVDWLPWNHTFGGNHNIGLTLYNGGSIYLDQGKPMPGGIEETVRNLREISPTVYFNVPKGYESLLPYLRDDAALRAKFFAKLHAMFFSGAALSPYVWNSLDELSVRETGARVPMLTGLGATETAPFFMSVNPRTSRSGHVGLPVPGNDAKLVPVNGKLEARAKGPNVTPGYWRQPELTKAAFDEEGFYRFGDAIKPADAERFRRRLRFRRPHCRGFQAGERHLGQRRAVARALHRRLRAAGARRRDCRHQPRRTRRDRDPRSRWLPPDQSEAQGRRYFRRRQTTPPCARHSASVSRNSWRPRPVRRTASPARFCSMRRCRSIAARSPTRARSTSARCWSIALI